MAYSTEFQIQATCTNQNKEALMAKYCQGLKLKVQDALILIKDTKDMTSLIKQAIKIDNRIFQRERANKGSNSKPTPVYKVLQQVQKLWYSAKLIDLSGI